MAGGLRHSILLGLLLPLASSSTLSLVGAGGSLVPIAHTDAMFGALPFGETLKTRLWYAGDGCSRKSSHPALGGLLGGGPFAVLADRGGGCSFGAKARAAQANGAVALLVAGSGAEPTNAAMLTMTDKEEEAEAEAQEQEEQVQGQGQGQGQQAHVTIPAMFIPHAEGVLLRERWLATKAKGVRLQLSWAMPAAARSAGREPVRWELWASAFDDAYGELRRKEGVPLSSLAAIASALGERASFAPRLFAVRGTAWYDDEAHALLDCTAAAAAAEHPECAARCTNGGRYCLPGVGPEGGKEEGEKKKEKKEKKEEKEEKEEEGVGRALLQEGVRKICLARFVAGRRGARVDDDPELWWRYSAAFSARCASHAGAVTLACSTRVLASVGGRAAVRAVAHCVAAAGGTDPGGGPNAVLEAECKDSERRSVFEAPTLRINGEPFKGDWSCPMPLRLATCGVLRMLCSAFEEPPPACAGRFWEQQQQQQLAQPGGGVVAAPRPAEGQQRRRRATQAPLPRVPAGAGHSLFDVLAPRHHTRRLLGTADA